MTPVVPKHTNKGSYVEFTTFPSLIQTEKSLFPYIMYNIQ